MTLINVAFPNFPWGSISFLVLIPKRKHHLSFPHIRYISHRAKAAILYGYPSFTGCAELLVSSLATHSKQYIRKYSWNCWYTYIKRLLHTRSRTWMCFVKWCEHCETQQRALILFGKCSLRPSEAEPFLESQSSKIWPEASLPSNQSRVKRTNVADSSFMEYAISRYCQGNPHCVHEYYARAYNETFMLDYTWSSWLDLRLYVITSLW